MRDSNYSSAIQNRPLVSISPAMYDRRAIDAPVPSLPLISTLTNLVVLTASSPKIRDLMVSDGGLERLVQIVRVCLQKRFHGDANLSPFKSFIEYHPAYVPDLASLQQSQLFKQSVSYQHCCSLTFQCIVHIGVRGSELIRTRVVEAGALEVVVQILEIYKGDAQRYAEQHFQQLQGRLSPPAYDGEDPGAAFSGRDDVRIAETDATPFDESVIPEPVPLPEPTPTNDLVAEHFSPQQQVAQLVQEHRERAQFVRGGVTRPRNVDPDDSFTYGSLGGLGILGVLGTDLPNTPHDAMDVDSDECVIKPLDIEPEDPAFESRRKNIVYKPSFRPDDIVQGLQLLAYLSKYGHVRHVFHANSIEQQEMLDDSSSSLTDSSSPSDNHFAHRCESEDDDASERGIVMPAKGAVQAIDATELHHAGEASADAGAVGTAPVMQRSKAIEAQAETSAGAKTARHAGTSRVALSEKKHASVQMGTEASECSLGAKSGLMSRVPPPTDECMDVDEDAVDDDSSLDEKTGLTLDDMAAELYAQKTQFYPYKTRPETEMCFYIRPTIKNADAALATRYFVISRVHIQSAKNIFLLVEMFTQRTAHFPTEVQYWAGVIMRNACKKDESRGGIRQCANMGCGIWESYPHQFAKCRRCRKAKYCSKICQSTAWMNGHRNWCSKAKAKETSSANATAVENDSQ